MKKRQLEVELLLLPELKYGGLINLIFRCCILNLIALKDGMMAGKLCITLPFMYYFKAFLCIFLAI